LVLVYMAVREDTNQGWDIELVSVYMAVREDTNQGWDVTWN